MTPQELNDELKQTMKNHDTNKRDSIRLVLAEVKNKSIEKQTDPIEQDVTNALKKIWSETYETFIYVQKTDNVERTNMLRERLEYLKSLIPAQLEGDELITEIDKIVAANDFSSKKDIGKVMKMLQEQTDGNFDRSAAGCYLNRKF